MLKVSLHLCHDVPEWHRLETHFGQVSEEEEAAEAALCGPQHGRPACEERFLLPTARKHLDRQTLLSWPIFWSVPPATPT